MHTTLFDDMTAAADLSPPYSEAWYRAHRHCLSADACRRLGIFVIPADFLLSVVIPVYNEHATIVELIERVREVPIRKQIIVVNDGSRDGTTEVLQALERGLLHDDLNEIEFVHHEINQGKGAALQTGFHAARGHAVTIQDADWEYDPAELPRLLQPIVEGEAEVVYGSRFRQEAAQRVVHFRHYLGNQVLTVFSNWCTNLRLSDMETCYKVFRRDVIKSILPTLREKRFGFEPEITAKIARRRYQVCELPISYRGRSFSEGKKIGWRDGFRALWCIVKYAIKD